MLFTEEECLEIIEACQTKLSPATVQVGEGPYVDESLRKAQMCYPEEVETLGKHLQKMREAMEREAKLPQSHLERIQYVKYGEGDFFGWHADGDEREVSFIVYLNDDYIGGETQFHPGVSRKGKTGEMLKFPRGLRHRSVVVTEGEKHVLVCWARSSPVGPSDSPT